MRLAVVVGLAVLLAAARPVLAEDEPSPFSPPPENDGDLNQPQLHFSKMKAGKRNVLFVWAGIDQGDSERFREAMEAAKPIEEIWFFSPGGALEEGLEIGRIIRKHKFATRIKGDFQCISACNFMFMGGTIRTIEPGGVFAVHMFANDIHKAIKEDVDAALEDAQQHNEKHPDDKVDVDARIEKVMDEDIKEVQQDAAQTAAEIARFLTEMELSLRFLTAFASIPNETPRALTRDELRDFNIVNTD